MPILEASASQTQTTDEISFGFEELFFSRTDPNGIIAFGNDVFQRVSVYSWDELVGRPHKIVRHPDTPRAVFWLLWRTIKSGAPIGAYVKNRTKDGRYYWVFAIATPIEGGFLSVRLRPSSPLLDVIKSEYAALAALERRENLSPEESAARLLARLKELGFADYRSFMATALAEELAARDVKLGHAPDQHAARYLGLLSTAQGLLDLSDSILSASVQTENVPFNFRILAAQLGQAGSAIGVISANYSLLSTDMKSILEQFIASAREVFETIGEGCFLSGVARVQLEVQDVFEREIAGSSGADLHGAEHERNLLDAQRCEYQRRASAALIGIVQTAQDFRQACLGLNRLSAGLEVTRIMGKVECARHANVKERTDELLFELEAFQRTLIESLKGIENINHKIRRDADDLSAGNSASRQKSAA